MGARATVLCCSWIAMQVAGVASVCRAQTLPSTQPSGAIVDITLEDPLTAQSRCYLDLDTGKTYPRGETQPDLNAARQFICEHGIDLMCESREPARGMVVYDMAIVDEPADLHQPPEFSTLRRRFEKVESTPFDFLTPGEVLPRRYLFRSREGTVGLLEIVEHIDNPRGIRLRYRAVPEPPYTLPRNLNAGEIKRLVASIRMQEAHLQDMQKAYSADDPHLSKAQERLQEAREELRIFETEEDPAAALLKQRQEQVRNARLKQLLDTPAWNIEVF